MSFRQFIPRRLQSNYHTIMNCKLIQNKVVDDTSLRLLQTLLNESQAQNQNESMIQKTVQFLYRQNTSSFYKFLIKNKLSYVVLWTESKCIVRHLGLQGLVYIRWNHDENFYEVLSHKNRMKNESNYREVDENQEHTSVDRIVAQITRVSYSDETSKPILEVETESVEPVKTESVEPVKTESVAVPVPFTPPIVQLEKTVDPTMPFTPPIAPIKEKPVKSWASIASQVTIAPIKEKPVVVHHEL